MRPIPFFPYTGGMADVRNPTMVAFGMKLKAAREAKFESAKDFADHIGINDFRYRKYERGTANPPIDILKRMAAALDVSMDSLLPIKRPKDSAANNRG